MTFLRDISLKPNPMKPTFLLLLALVTSFAASAQKNDEDEIKAVLKTLFDGMYEGDSSKVHSVFTSSITMATVTRDKTGSPVLRQESSLDGFLKAVGTPNANKMTEEFWNVTVQQDGDLAQVWCDYAFYINHTFSHCGVDAFHMYRTKNGWKIFNLADTRKREGCNIPAEIQAKHKQ